MLVLTIVFNCAFTRHVKKLLSKVYFCGMSPSENTNLHENTSSGTGVIHSRMLSTKHDQNSTAKFIFLTMPFLSFLTYK